MYKFYPIFSIQMTPFLIDFKSVWPLIFTKPYIWLGPSFFGVLNPGTENLMKSPARVPEPGPRSFCCQPMLYYMWSPHIQHYLNVMSAILTYNSSTLKKRSIYWCRKTMIVQNWSSDINGFCKLNGQTVVFAHESYFEMVISWLICVSFEWFPELTTDSWSDRKCWSGNMRYTCHWVYRQDGRWSRGDHRSRIMCCKEYLLYTCYTESLGKGQMYQYLSVVCSRSFYSSTINMINEN